MDRYNCIVVEFRDVFTRFMPDSDIESYIYRSYPRLRSFIRNTGLHFLLEAAYAVNRDVPSFENTLWEMYEDRVKEDSKWELLDNGEIYGRDPQDYDWLEILYNSIVEQADLIIGRQLVNNGLAINVNNYVIDKWVTATSAMLVESG